MLIAIERSFLDIRQWNLCVYLYIQSSTGLTTLQTHCVFCKRWLPWDLRVVAWLRSSLLSPLFVSNEPGDASRWQPTQGVLVGRHPLMAADEWGASRATGVRVGRMRGPSRWGLIWPLPFTPSSSTDRLPSHNGTEQQQTLHLQSHQMKMRGVCYIKSISDCQASQTEIHHWHLEFVWWPEMERLDFRCLTLNCTAGARQ